MGNAGGNSTIIKLRARLSLFLAVVLLLSMGALATGCEDKQVQNANTQEQNVDSQVQNRARIELDGNPTTGYNWTYTLSGEGVVQEVSSDYVPDPNSIGATGAGGTFVFEFESIAEGEVEITFLYRREWEDVVATRTAVYRATVDADLNLTLTQVS
jgi:inhibitor of cysteine peptidase